MRALAIASLILFLASRPSIAVSAELLVCKGDGFVVALSSMGKLRLSENGKSCEIVETRVSDHRRSTFSHIQILGVKRACPGFENWMPLLDVKIQLDDRKTGQVIGRIAARNENEKASDLTPSCTLGPVDLKKLDLFFLRSNLSSKRE